MTPREIVNLQRDGARAMARRLTIGTVLPCDWQGIDAEVTTLFPYPKVKRPRVVVSDNDREFRIFNGELQTRTEGCNWTRSVWNSKRIMAALPSDAADIKAIADLLANPTEEVAE